MFDQGHSCVAEDVEPARAEFRAVYDVDSPLPPADVAEIIAGEQSCGTFASLPSETPELQRKARARVVSVSEVEFPRSVTPLPSAFLSHDGVAGPTRRARIEIAFPTDNVGANLPTLLATVAGNLFELGQVTGLRLRDVSLPESLARLFPGPAFGIAGTRRMSGVAARPLIGTIMKPSVGLSPDEAAAIVDMLCQAEIDFIKDDELMADPPSAPLKARVDAIMPVIHRHADRLGRQVMFAFNVSGDWDAMRRSHDHVLDAGGTCVMASLNWVGFSGLETLRRHSQLPIHGHRNGWGLFARSPSVGIDFTAYQKLWRLAGVDQLHVNGLASKFWEDDASVIRSGVACLEELPGLAAIMPVLSSGQWGGQAPDTYSGLGTTDLMYLAGGGIFAHPGGPAAGVLGLRQAWEATVTGVDLALHARIHPELAATLTTFGHRRRT